MIKMIKGVSGYRTDKSPFRYPCGQIVSDTAEVEHDLVKSGLAVYHDVEVKRAVAVTPMIERDRIVQAVVKRRRHV